ncbi:unnamed protein product [Calypogeia fissa]
MATTKHIRKAIASLGGGPFEQAASTPHQMLSSGVKRYKLNDGDTSMQEVLVDSQMQPEILTHNILIPVGDPTHQAPAPDPDGMEVVGSNSPPKDLDTNLTHL